MWNKVENKYTLPRPPKGKDIVLDKILETIEFLDCELAKLLEEVRENLQTKKVAYVHTQKYKY